MWVRCATISAIRIGLLFMMILWAAGCSAVDPAGRNSTIDVTETNGTIVLEPTDEAREAERRREDERFRDSVNREVFQLVPSQRQLERLSEQAQGSRP